VSMGQILRIKGPVTPSRAVALVSRSESAAVATPG
jgi:hypothetical protein